jgi:L-asparaginase II
MNESNPILIEVLRGTMVESRHHGAAAVVDAEGSVVAAWGDIERPVYARSAIKPLQALPLIETGAADRFTLADEEIALACASHAGEPEHVRHVERWLARIGLTSDDLECGPHAPLNEEASAALLRDGASASALHNNCSGKHTGFLTTAVHLGLATRGYIHADHPVQRYWQEVLTQMSSTDLASAPTGVDGCGIPVRGLSLRATAAAMAQLAAPIKLMPVRAAAAARVLRAMANAPFMVAGSGRFCTEVMRYAGAQVALKTGAEGVYVAALPRKQLGVALKIDDGAPRAATLAMATILCSLGVLDDAASRALAPFLQPVVYNRAGLAVGTLRAARGWLHQFSLPAAV